MATHTPDHARRTAFGALSLAGILALSACGGGSGDDGDSSGSEQDSNTVAIGVEASYPPGEFLEDDGETVQGFNVDLVEAALAEMGMEARWVPSAFDSIITGVQSGEYDLGASSFTVTEERMQAVNMVSYFSSGTQWFAQEGNPQGVDPENPCGMRIAVQSNTTHDEDITARGEACVEAGEEAVTIERFPSQPQATETVVSGLNDASLADMPTSAYALEQTGDGVLEFIGEQYNAAPYGIVVHLDDEEFAQELADAFGTIMENGTYDGILTDWGIEAGAIEAAEVNPPVEG
ncbi:ABC transporter substrate-binding protein [Nocardiopsis sp. CNR-923]|uniref:ABC transporter substrate-binding protein n=1 Tax=Nocardiopsis sp. CNR-923 TaxID=1904965 RepID=UPI000962D89B|nr:ABC transporter substrate-binding protein [Nocardiopsis sp. CNR-923]OLT28161.1 ABC transporter substrate-binding protein [Nocardiopsis sp. CNR-923]